METTCAPTRRSLPPVPRTEADAVHGGERLVERHLRHRLGHRLDRDLTHDLTRGLDRDLDRGLDRGVAPPDAGQQFVARLRSAAADFAAAAGADAAVVREAVPPARHRRSRCRVALRFPDGGESDLTFLGASGRPGTPSRLGFDRQIQRWLGSGLRQDPEWLVADDEAPDGVAVDLAAWLAVS